MPELSSSPPPRPRRSPWRFGLGSLLMVVLVIAMGLAWWRDHRRLASQLELANMRLRSLERRVWESKFSGGFVIPTNEPDLRERFPTAEAYLAFLQSGADFDAVQDTFWPLNRSSLREEVLPGLLNLLDSPDARSRKNAAQALQYVKSNPEQVIPKLVARLDDSDWQVAWYAARTLGEYGSEASEAVPALEKHMQDDNSPIVARATFALKEIEPMRDIGPRLLQLVHTVSNRYEKQNVILELPDHVTAHVAERTLTELFNNETDPEIRKVISEAITNARLSVNPNAPAKGS